MLTTTSQYALRALSYLASQQGGVSVLGRELAQKVNIPENYLAKIMLTLRNAGILDTTRGKGGGYRLRRPPREITLIEVVELFDGAEARLSCILGASADCSDEHACSAHKSWRAVRRKYLHFLEGTSVATIAHNDGFFAVGPAAKSASKSLGKKRGVRRP